ncbi:MAG: hypothetical protein M1324_01275 [Patescibacteria group bacterium]|nr:hypothetical protein [Patescibacteria group bacterium]
MKEFRIALISVGAVLVFFGLAWLAFGYPVWRLEHVAGDGHWPFGYWPVQWFYLVVIIHDWLTCTIVGTLMAVALALGWRYCRSDKPSPPPRYRFKTFLDG